MLSVTTVVLVASIAPSCFSLLLKAFNFEIAAFGVLHGAISYPRGATCTLVLVVSIVLLCPSFLF